MSGSQSSIMGGGVRIGQVIQSPVDLEALYPGEFMRLDGRDVLRSAVSSALSANFGGGVFSATSRTMNAAPNSAVVAADSTNFLVPGAAGTSPLQASADGITWSTSATWAASSSVYSIIVAGSRYVAAGVGGDLSSPFVSNTGQTAANQVAKANWSATTSGFTTTLAQGLAYSSTLGLTVGIPSVSGNTVYALADGATEWVSRTVPTNLTKMAVCWTGQKFIVLCASPSGAGNNVGNIIQTSSDGITWSDQYVPGISFNNSAPGPAMASDGNGTVVITIYLGANARVLVSKDHGATWRNITIPNDLQKYGVSPVFVWFVNSKFIILTNSVTLTYGAAMLVSSDGLSWGVEPIGYRGVLLSNPVKAVAYKSGVYCFTGITTSALTATEDMTKFRLPETWNFSGVSGQAAFQLRQEFIKVA